MPCRNPPELLDPAKEALDQVAVFVLLRVKFPLLFAVVFQGDNRPRPSFFKLGQQVVGIVGLVGQHRALAHRSNANGRAAPAPQGRH
jgi:hypothetical protein